MPLRQRGDWELRRLDSWDGTISLRLDIAGQTFVRHLDPHDPIDRQDLQIAGSFWDHADRAARMGYQDAMVTERCMAVERLFPESSELLPA